MAPKKQIHSAKTNTRRPPLAKQTARSNFQQQSTNLAALIQRASADPDSLTAQGVLRLQPAVGNRATRRLLGPTGQVQTQRPNPKEGGDVSTEVEASIQSARGRGQPLAETVRAPMEQAFGADFSNVKVHADIEANRLNRSVQASAFTTGHDIFFREGEYKPGSHAGQQLIAHELTHVVQQNGSQLRRKAPSANGQPLSPITPAAPQNPNQIQRKWYVWNEIAIWVQENSTETKTECPEGYSEVEGTPDMYGDGWQPYGETHNIEVSPMQQVKKLTIKKIGQQEKGWCYAATSKIVDDYVAGTNVPLWQYVQTYQQTHGHPKASTMNESDIRENFGNAYGVETFLHTQYSDQAAMLTEEIIFQSLYLMNSPLVLGLGTYSYVMYGYDPQTKQLFLWDPLINENVDYYTIATLNELYVGNLDIFYGFLSK